MNVTYLLGAGASCDAGLPTAVGLLDEFMLELPHTTTAWCGPAAEALLHLLRRNRKLVTVEDLAIAARMIRQRTEDDVWALTSGLLGELAAFASAGDACPYTELEHSIFEFMHQRLSGGKETAPYLAALLQMPRHATTRTVCTLNQDALLEDELDRTGVAYSTGFILPIDNYRLGIAGGIPFWPQGYVRRVLRENGADHLRMTIDGQPASVTILKLHGSTDWYRVESPSKHDPSTGRRMIGQDPITKWRGHVAVGTKFVMLAGGLDKTRREEPFRTLQAAFCATLEATELLIVVGYSFSDFHINQAIIDMLVYETSASPDIVVVNGKNWPDPGDVDSPTMSPDAQGAWSWISEAAKDAVEHQGCGELIVIKERARDAIGSASFAELLTELTRRRQLHMQTVESGSWSLDLRFVRGMPRRGERPDPRKLAP